MYALLTVGEKISHSSTRAFAQGDYVRGMMLDAMADAALFSMEAGLQRGLKAACKEWIRGIERRLEAPRDIPMEIQREAFWQCEAERTLQLGLTEGFLFSPLKTSCQIYITTENTDVFRAAHTCRKCPQLSCAMRHEEPLEIRIVTEEGEEGQTIVYETGTVWEAIREKAEGNSFPCGGSGHCGKCGIQVLQGELPVSREDKQKFTQAELEQGWRLACRAKPVESITIKLGWQKETKIRAVAGFSQAAVTEAMPEEKVISQKQREEYGFAIDLGTATLAIQLISLRDGRCLDTYTGLNGQRDYGADVIARIQASLQGEREALQKRILRDLWTGMERLRERGGLPYEALKRIVLVGNTTMLHLLLAYPCDGLGCVPFQPYYTGKIQMAAAKLFPELPREAKLLILPGISAFVGADIVSGLYALKLYKQKENCLLIDLGTNGEMVLGNREGFLAVSVAAGPAFEGGNIRWGTGSIPGTISGAHFEQGALTVETIQNQPPMGICGTGVLELTEALLKGRIIDETGRIGEDWFDTGYPVAVSREGQRICLTQADIREIQLAKAAVRAGIQALLERSGLTEQQLHRVYIAGGFGYYLDAEKAIAIGMFPPAFSGKIQAVGNSALRGAAGLLLPPEEMAEAEMAAGAAREIELSTDTVFQNTFMEAMLFS